ncbi:hypothetical protein LOTGIDRAFT_164389, partial [Lottia gigantea]
MGVIKIYLLLVLSLLLDDVTCQLTGIALNPDTISLKERQKGSLNLTLVEVTPAGTIVNCDIVNVDSPPATAITDYPFQRSFTTVSANNIQWYVFYNEKSPQKLDYDVYNTYEVTVECAGITGIESDILTINIIENQAPIITQGGVPTAGLNMSTDASAIIKNDLLYTVTANDPDGDPLTYDYKTTPQVNYFDINPVTHEILAAVDFLAVAVSPVTITVNVSDGDKSKQLIIRVIVNDLNSRPEITNLPESISIPENTPAGTQLILLKYNDVDRVQIFNPTCTVTPATSASVFTLGSRIYVAGKPDGTSRLDYESIKSFSISCTIFDDYLYSDGTDILTVNITDINEPPVFTTQPNPCQLTESQARVSTCKLGMVLNDPEGDSFTLSIVNNAESQRFQFTSPDAQYLTFSVDYDVDNGAMPSSVQVEIKATDSAGQSSSAQIMVAILDKNDNSPVFLPNQGVDVTPSTTVGTVGKLQVTDNDSGSNSEIEFALLNINPSVYSDFISILPSGQVHYTKKFPSSMQDTTAILTIRATDKGSPPLSSTGVIIVRFLSDVTVPVSIQSSATATGDQPGLSPTASSKTQETFFDQPTNIAIVVVLAIVLLILLLVAFYFCIKRMLLGYCCGPGKESSVYPSSDEYGYQNNYHRRYNSGYYKEPLGYQSKYPIRDRIEYESNYPGSRPVYHKEYTSYSDVIRDKPLYARQTSTIK